MRSLGLRAQIVLALAALMVIGFVPLYFAMAQLTRVTLQSVRETSARALGRAVAGNAADLPEGDHLEGALAAQVGEGGVEALCVFSAEGARVACAGAPEEVAGLSAPPSREGAFDARGAHGRALDVVVPRASGGAVIARLRTDDAVDRAAPLVRLFAGYTSAFAIAIVFVAYVVLTRLIVRPLESVAGAADRVASGAPRFELPRGGPREIAQLGDSVREMALRLRADEAKLRGKIGELEAATRRLTEAQSQLVRSERLASVGRLAAGLAHEIGNPIAAILGLEEMILTANLSPEEQLDFVRRMKRETERVHEILRDLLDFARPEREPESSAGARASVAAVVSDVIELLRPQRAMKGVLVESRCEGEARVSPSKLTQVLLNLSLNAGDAMSGAGRLIFASEVDGDRVRITVTDTGPGIPPELREKLFEPFVTTKEPGSGTGLGLAVCRGIVESAGGTIELDSGHEGGARFVLMLPRV